MSRSKNKNRRSDKHGKSKKGQSAGLRAIERIVESERSARRENGQSDIPNLNHIFINKQRSGSLLSDEDLISRNVLPGRSADRQLSDEMRALRGRMLQLAGQRQSGNVLITGIVRGSGSTFTCVNLAAVMRMGNPVIIVDADIENRGLTEVLGADEQTGLNDYLSQKAGIDDVVWDSPLENVHLVPVGKSENASKEFVDEYRVREFFRKLRARAPSSWILIDGPPLSVSADNRCLSELSDFSLVVVAYAQVTGARLEQALSTIDRNKIAGVVYNRLPNLLRGGL